MKVDPRLTQLETKLGAARLLIAAIEREGGHTPVEQSRLRQVDQYLRNGLATLGWFTHLYPDEHRGQAQ